VIFGSVCSGIEAASVAWNPLGWRCAFMSEIEAFPRAVLKHHYEDIPLHGDFTTIQAGEYEPIDVLVGGTPCQSFSIAGLRGGMDDARGNLALGYLRLADRLRPRWVVWENVPGVRSSDAGRDFGAFLGGLGELGYGWAYASLDAQYFGLAQRRERVFVVGYLGDWRRAAAVLFESASMRGDSPPGRKPGEGIAPTISSRPTGGGGLGTDFDLDGGLITGTLNTSIARGTGGANEASFLHVVDSDCTENLIAHTMTARMGRARGTACVDEPALVVGTLQSGGTNRGHGTAGTNNQAVAAGHIISVSHTLGTKYNASEDGTGHGTPLVAYAIQERAVSENLENGPQGKGYQPDIAYTLEARNKVQSVSMPGVRRLMPVECEKLQGLPPGYTDVPYRGKPAADGPRYRAIGNSFAVPVVRWIGERIAISEACTAA